MLKTTLFVAAALVASGLSAAAIAKPADAGWNVNATWVAYSLQEQIPGTVLSVEPRGKTFVARIAGAAGTVRKIVVMAEGGRIKKDEVEGNFQAAGLVSVAAILPELAKTGWYDLRRVTLEDDHYEIIAANEMGRVARIQVDPRTGAIVNAPALARANGIDPAG